MSLSQIQLTGPLKELLPMLKTKDNVDHVGLSQHLEPQKDLTSLKTEIQFHCLNKPWLIVQEVMVTKDVMED